MKGHVQLFWCGSFLLFSTVSGILYKLLVTSLFFEFPLMVMLVQNGVSLIVITSLSRKEINVFKSSTLKHFLLPSLSWTLATYMEMASVDDVSYPSSQVISHLCLPCFALFAMDFFATRRLLKWAILVAVSSCLAVSMGKVIDQYSLFWAICQCALQVFSYYSVARLLSEYSTIGILAGHYFCSTSVLFAVELVQHSIYPVAEYLLIWRFPSFFQVFFCLIVCTLFSQYSLLKTIQHKDVFSVSIIKNTAGVIQFLVFYYLYRYVCMQTTWKHYTLSNVLFGGVSIFSTLFIILQSVARSTTRKIEP